MAKKKPPVQQMTEAFDAMIDHGNLEAIIDLFGEDSTFEEPAVLPYGGIFRGKDQVRMGFLGMMAYWDDIEFVMPRMVDGGDIVISILPFKAKSKAKGITASFDVIELWQFDSENSLTSVRISYVDIKRILDALGVEVGTVGLPAA